MGWVQPNLFDPGEPLAKPVVRIPRVRRKRIQRTPLIPLIDLYLVEIGRRSIAVGNVILVSPGTAKKPETHRDRISRKRQMRKLRKHQKLPLRLRRLLDEPCSVVDGTKDGRWLDRYIWEQGTAEVRALWSPQEERKRRLGLNADQRDPNENVGTDQVSLADIFSNMSR